MADTPTTGELLKVKAIACDEVDAAVDALLAKPDVGPHPIEGGYLLDLSAAIKAHKPSLATVTYLGRPGKFRRAMARTAMLLARPRRDDDHLGAHMVRRPRSHTRLRGAGRRRSGWPDLLRYHHRRAGLVLGRQRHRGRAEHGRVRPQRPRGDEAGRSGSRSSSLGDVVGAQGGRYGLTSDQERTPRSGCIMVAFRPDTFHTGKDPSRVNMANASVTSRPRTQAVCRTTERAA